MHKLKQTIKLTEWRPDKKYRLPEYLEDLPKNSRDLVVAIETAYAEIATRVNWLIDRADGYYASIYQHDEAVDIALAAQDTYYQVTGFTTNGPYNAATPDYSENHITITKTGDYQVWVNIACHSHASNLYEVVIHKNNGTTEYGAIALHFNTATAGRVVNGFTKDVLALTKDDTIEAWVKREDGGSATKTLTIDCANIGLKRVGEPD